MERTYMHEDDITLFVRRGGPVLQGGEELRS